MLRVTRCCLGHRRLPLKCGASVACHHCIYYVECCVGSSDVAAGARPGQNSRAGFIDGIGFYCVVVAGGPTAIIQVNASFGAAVHYVARRRISVTAQIDSIKNLRSDDFISSDDGVVSQKTGPGALRHYSELRISNRIVRHRYASRSDHQNSDSCIAIVVTRVA